MDPISIQNPCYLQQDVFRDVLENKIFSYLTKIEHQQSVTVSKYWEELSKNFRWKLIVLASQTQLKELPMFNYQNLIALTKEVVVKLKDNVLQLHPYGPKGKNSKQFIVGLKEVNFVALSKLEGVIELKSKNDIRYYRLSKEELNAFLKINCNATAHWNSFMNSFMRTLREKIHLNYYVMNCSKGIKKIWESFSEEKINNWMNSVHVKDAFFLPQSVIDADKGYPPNSSCLIFQGDFKCDHEQLKSSMSNLLGTDNEFQKICSYLFNIAKTLRLYVIESPEGFPPDQLVFALEYDQKLKDEAMKNLQKPVSYDINELHSVLLQVINDPVKVMIIKSIVLPEFFGIPEIRARSPLIIGLPKSHFSITRPAESDKSS